MSKDETCCEDGAETPRSCEQEGRCPTLDTKDPGESKGSEGTREEQSQKQEKQLPQDENDGREEEEKNHQADPNHNVQFYEDPDYLCRSVGQFAAEGLKQGEGVLIVAGRLHMEGIERELAAALGVEAAAHRNGQLSTLDADDLLSKFMVHDVPDPGLFMATVGSLVETLLERFTRLRIYGEMVNILCLSGRRDAAISLERLWNRLASRQQQRGRPFSLLCGYAIDQFGREEHTRVFHDVCSVHAHVVPAESYETLWEECDNQRRLIAHLQQQAMALQAEVTQRRAVESELREAKEAAETANRAKSMFLTIISHELRTPLTAIVGYADLMLASSGMGETSAVERREIIEIIARNGREVVCLLNDVLDLSKVEAGALRIQHVPYSPADLVSDAVRLLHLQALEKNLRPSVDVGPDVPDRVLGDPTRWRQILLNLVVNAIRYTPAGGAIDIVMRMRSPVATDSTPTIECTVRDSGCGMTSAQAQHLFQPFSQGPAGSTGIGLFLSRQLACLMGGDLVLTHTAPGEGTTFSVTIPASPVLPATNEEQRPAKEAIMHTSASVNAVGRLETNSPGRPTVDCASISILVVDDNAVNRRLIQRVLHRLGHTDVAEAADGIQAVNHVAAHHCDLILMDLQMPMMDGHSACKAIRKLYEDQQRAQQPVIIALTAQVLGDERDQCLASGMDDFMNKPFDLALLRQKLAHWASAILHQRGSAPTG